MNEKYQKIIFVHDILQMSSFQHCFTFLGNTFLGGKNKE